MQSSRLLQSISLGEEYVEHMLQGSTKYSSYILLNITYSFGVTKYINYVPSKALSKLLRSS